jgi:hypothetical protein
MKKQILSIASIALVAGALVMSGCKKDDTTAPTISLVGNSTVDVDFKGTYTDDGATANDDNDGDLTSKVVVSNPVVTTSAETYTVTYNVSDEAGNAAAEVTRTVNVVIKGANMAGTYSVKDDVSGSVSTYGDAVTVSGADPNKIIVAKFANYTNGQVYMMISGTNGTTVTIPNQTVSCGLPPNVANRQFSGTGTIAKDGKTMTLNYTEVTNGSTATGVETYTLQ